MERVLIIEDELPMRTALQDVLEGEGYRVLTAAEGEAACNAPFRRNLISSCWIL